MTPPESFLSPLFPQSPSARLLGGRVGPYRLDEMIGSGGMGTVFRASRADGAFARAAAVKVLRGMDDAESAARLRREVDALARLDHPSIVRIVDAGQTPHGDYYLVQDFVPGLRLDRWASETGPSLDARLEVFLGVCDAVAFAHRHLIVHRDIKPSNIIVDPDGKPKLLDFGIAKLLDAEETTHTASPLTPLYASPEQILGGPVTTSSDIYSLGVVLYRLLTGHLPHGALAQSSFEQSRAVVDATPIPPSRHDPRFAGDLEAILLKSLAKDPRERYSTVDALAADLARFRRSEPVSARRPSWRYTAYCFLRRHKLAAGFGIGFIVSVMGALAAMIHYSAIARHRDDLATIMAAAANARMGEMSNRPLDDRVINQLLSLSRRMGYDFPSQLSVMDVLSWQGDAWGKPDFHNWGDTAKAVERYSQAIELGEQIRIPAQEDLRVYALAGAHGSLGDVFVAEGRFDRARPHYARAYQLMSPVRGKPLSQPSGTHWGQQWHLAHASARWSLIVEREQGFAPAHALREEALSIAVAANAAMPQITGGHGIHGFQARLASGYFRAGNLPKALALYPEAIAGYGGRVAQFPAMLNLRLKRAMVRNEAAKALAAAGRKQEAAHQLRSAASELCALELRVPESESNRKLLKAVAASLGVPPSCESALLDRSPAGGRR